MNIRERLEAFWAGERPDRIPYTIYHNEWRHHMGDPAWEPMFAAGLGVTWPIATVESETPDVETIRQVSEENGKRVVRTIRRTPVGEIYASTVNSWDHDFWLRTAEDYRVMTYIVEHTQYRPAYEAFLAKEKEIAPWGIPHPWADRTPMQKILVDFVGLENFGVHLFELEDELMTLYAALLKQYRRFIEIIAEGPGRFVAVYENFTADTMGPNRFKQYHVPVYEELFRVLQSAGKVVGTHYDGRLAACKEAVAAAPIDLIESLTPPPEGDMTLAECRAAWPDKLFWSNLNVACYDLPPEELRALVLDRAHQASPDGKRLAFEVSEHIPGNWRESMPVVLEALGE